jgi:hypothetical protein
MHQYIVSLLRSGIYLYLSVCVFVYGVHVTPIDRQQFLLPADFLRPS